MSLCFAVNLDPVRFLTRLRDGWIHNVAILR